MDESAVSRDKLRQELYTGRFPDHIMSEGY